MDELLFLVHRIPYPPDKGDKVRSYNLLRYLARNYRVHLGTFIDDPDDRRHIEAVRALCADAWFAPIDRRITRLRSLVGFAGGEALSLPFYRDAELRRWVDGVLATGSVRKAVVFSSPMAQYLMDRRDLRRIADFVDVDSQKWAQYASTRRWPLSWLYAREARQLARFEQEVAREFDASVFVTRAESRLFRRLSGVDAERVHAIPNGVDTSYFSPQVESANPYPQGSVAGVFTGAMDYWPNVDAAEWFVREVLPKIRSVRPDFTFVVVGARPTERVLRLAGSPGVQVTGTVPDVRPYLQHADIAVAPLRIARGIQNKVLEAMAMGKPVVATAEAAEGVNAVTESEIFVVSSAEDFARRVIGLIRTRQAVEAGARARARVCNSYDWGVNLAAFGRLLDGEPVGHRANRGRLPLAVGT